jgi:NADPH:quinone reductase-like Zn-dependent oxidoreductase
MRTQTMHAVLLTGFGGPEKLVYRTDIPVPVPGVDEVLIRVGACGVNNTDVWTREGAYGADEQSGWQGGSFQFPRIQGADSVGQIVETGDGVSKARVGERVMVNPTIYPDGEGGLFNATYLGSERDGGFAQYVRVPSQNAHAIDSPLTDAELATFMTSYLTAEHMLNRAEVKAGETVLITGASGGVGSALVQLARIRGAQVVAVIGNGKQGQLAAFGVAGILFRGEGDYATALQQQTGRCTVDVVADIVAGDSVASLLDLLRVGGRYVAAGAIAGAQVTLDWRKLYLKHLTLLGSTMGTQEESRQIVAYVASRLLKPLLSATYPLNQLAQAQMDFKRKTHFGKLAMIP